MSAFHRFTTSLRRRPLALAALLAGAAALGACSEDVEGGATCPVLCPGTEVPLQDTVLRSIVDTARTVPGIVVAGTEFALPLAFWRDTLETRVVVRYDALVEQFTPTGATAADTTQRITRADSARLRIRFDRAATSLRRRPLALAALLASAAALGACSEDVEGGATCPVLCPGTEVPLQDTVLRSIVDTARTVPGIVVAGTEFALPLAFWRDTLETRVVVRYDALVEQFTPTGTTAADTTQRITRADSARLRIRFDRDASTLPDTFFLSAYDVDAVGAGEDTAAAVIESRLTPDRLLGSWGYGRASLAGDSLFLRISDSAVTARLTDPDTARRRMRIALVASAPSGKVILRVDAAPTAGGGSSPRLLYRPRNLATGKSDTLFRQSLPFSETPVGDVQTAGELADFAVVRVAPPPGGDPALLQVGGIPARRAYLQFDLDEDLLALLDSTTIVRAELRLVQVPSTLPDLLDTVKVGDVMTPRRDTVTLLPLVGVANNSVRDPARRAQLAVRAVRLIGAAGTPDSLFAPTLALLPSGAGERVIDVTRLVRNWRRQSPDQPRYLVLAAGAEGQQPGALFFHPPSAGPGLRPRLYVRYVPRVGYGIP